MKNKKLILLIVTLIANMIQLCSANFKTIDQLKTYAASYQEYPDSDNDNWLNPDYTSFHKANLHGWFGKTVRFIKSLLRLSQKPVWKAGDFSILMEDVINKRETNGYIGRFVQKFVPPPHSHLVIFGDLHGSFHSLTRDLLDLYENGIIDQTYKIKNSYYFVFAGNTIDFSPFTLETLSLILQLMKVNPNKVFYIRGKHENKEHWRNFGLRRELNLRATGVVSEKLIKRFFGTLPLALYLIGRTGKKTEVVRISCSGRDYQELNEDNFSDFFIVDKTKKVGIRDLGTKEQTSQVVDVKAIIKCENRLTKHTPTEGLVQTDSDQGATAWFVNSGPNRTFRSLYKFFFDAFAVIKTNGQIDNWTISLYNQDVREKLGITKRKEYNLISGNETSLEIKKKAPAAQKTTEIAKHKEPPPVMASPKEIVVGTTLGLTGNIKEESESIRLGLQLRIDQENQKNGINGKRIRLIVLDDGYQPARARANALELINRYKINVILFPVGSATTKAYIDLVKEKKVVVLFSSSGSPALRNPTPKYFVHFRPSYIAMSEALISYAQKNLEAKRFVIVNQSDVSAVGQIETMKAAGISPNNFIEVTHKRNVTDISKQAELIKAFKPDAILFLSTSSASMAIIKELGAENLIGTTMLGTDLRNPRFNTFLKTMGLSSNYIDAQALPNPETSQIPILKEYRSQMGNKPIDGLSAEAYVGASIFIYLLKQTDGITDKEKIISAAENIKNVDLGGIKLSFDKGKLSRFIWLTTGKNWTAVDVKKLEQEKEKNSVNTGTKKRNEPKPSPKKMVPKKIKTVAPTAAGL